MTANLEDVQASFGRCCLNPEFLDYFYKAFLASSPEIAPHFKNTDFKKQKQMLQMGLNMLISYAMGMQAVEGYMLQLAEKHSRHNLNIEPRHYTSWTNSLMMAVKKFDSKYTPELEQKWRTALDRGIQLIKAKY